MHCRGAAEGHSQSLARYPGRLRASYGSVFVGSMVSYLWGRDDDHLCTTSVGVQIGGWVAYCRHNASFSDLTHSKRDVLPPAEL